MIDTSNIFEHDFHNPQRNLSSGEHRNYPESDFALKFALSYKKNFSNIHFGTTKRETLFIREVPVSGKGIADLLVFCWTNNNGLKDCTPYDLEKLNPTIRAFEFKLKNWRGGIMQAHRYKYFSHASILVVPKSILQNVGPHIDTLKALRIGLWGFNMQTGSITCVYTPRPKNQYMPKYGQKVIALAAQVACS